MGCGSDILFLGSTRTTRPMASHRVIRPQQNRCTRRPDEIVTVKGFTAAVAPPGRWTATQQDELRESQEADWLVDPMPIRFADISHMLRVADPRSGARLCEAQHVQSMRMPINRIGMVNSSVFTFTDRFVASPVLAAR